MELIILKVHSPLKQVLFQNLTDSVLLVVNHNQDTYNQLIREMDI